jgi:hypothetical protein
MRIIILLIPILVKSALAGWLEYPIQADFGSQQICATAAKNMDKAPGQSDVVLAVACKEGRMTGTVTANPRLTSVMLQIVWPSGVDSGCEQLMNHFQGSMAVSQINCQVTENIPLIPKSFLSKWVATFNLPLHGGKDIDLIQNEKITANENQERLREQAEEERSCEEALTHPGKFDKFLEHFFGRPCKWMQNPGATSPVSNVIVPGKEPPRVGGAGNDAPDVRSRSTHSGSLGN